jgi:hypothetical protein
VVALAPTVTTTALPFIADVADVVHQVGPYGSRCPRDPVHQPDALDPWLAIHVLSAGGKTLIFFVPCPKSATTP